MIRLFRTDTGFIGVEAENMNPAWRGEPGCILDCIPAGVNPAGALLSPIAGDFAKAIAFSFADRR